MSIIALVGRAESGKSTLAKHILSKTSELTSSQIVGFSEPIYEMITNFGFTIDEILDQDFRKIKQPVLGGKTIRELMIIIGHNLRKNVHKDIWVNVLLPKLKRSNVSIIENVRYHNELAAMKHYAIANSHQLITVGLKGGAIIDTEQEIAELIDICMYQYDNTNKMLKLEDTADDIIEALELVY